MYKKNDNATKFNVIQRYSCLSWDLFRFFLGKIL